MSLSDSHVRARPHGRRVIMISHVEPGSAAISDSLDLELWK